MVLTIVFNEFLVAVSIGWNAVPHVAENATTSAARVTNARMIIEPEAVTPVAAAPMAVLMVLANAVDIVDAAVLTMATAPFRLLPNVVIALTYAVMLVDAVVTLPEKLSPNLPRPKSSASSMAVFIAEAPEKSLPARPLMASDNDFNGPTDAETVSGTTLATSSEYWRKPTPN